MAPVPVHELDPAPPRPTMPLRPPADTLRVRVDVDSAHLANPLLAVARLLASESGALVHISGTEDRFEVCIAMSDHTPATVDHAEAWVRWAVHNAGIRGRVRRATS